MLRTGTLQVSDTGRPILEHGEVEQALTDKVDFQIVESNKKTIVKEMKDGRAIVTTHRLLWLHDASPSENNIAIPMPAIIDAALRTSAKNLWSSSHKVRLQVACDTSGRPVAGDPSSMLIVFCTLACRGSNVSMFHQRLMLAVQRARAALVASQPAVNPLIPGSTAATAAGPLGASATAAVGADRGHSQRQTEELEGQLREMGFNQYRAQRAAAATAGQGADAALEWLLAHASDPLLDLPPTQERYGGGPSGPLLAGTGPAAPTRGSGVGVGGILAREQERVAATDASLEAAFRDLRALMDQAQEMVALAERFRAAMQQQEGGGGDEDAALERELIAMGIASPVTKESAGAAYHAELARQLGDFLGEPLERAGGMLALPDVYCIFNRARGTELVSPNDLLAAAQLLPQVGAHMRLHGFASGVLVVQSASFSDAQVAMRIAALLGPPNAQELGSPLTSSDVAASMSVPITIAAEWLLSAEAQGVLCRDDGPEGLRYFKNFFAVVQVQAA